MEAMKRGTRGLQEGSFFGAILEVRWGEGLKTHIRDLLRKLESRYIRPGLTLASAFGYIAVMHAEGPGILSNIVLSEALGYDVNDLKRRTLRPLGEEAAITITGRLVFTRHRSIARAATEILEESIETDELYVTLAVAAQRAGRKGNYVPYLRDWHFLSSYFFDKGDHGRGLRIGKALHELEPANPYLVVNLARLYREAGQPEDGAALFRSASPHTQKDRVYYNEWGTTEGNAGRYALNAWLTSLTLADGTTRQLPDNQKNTQAFHGLMVAFEQLDEKYNAREFREAWVAAAQLGALVRFDESRAGQVQQRLQRARNLQIEPMSPSVALGKIRDGVKAAWNQREDDLPAWVIPGHSLTFEGVARVLQIPRT